MNKIQDQSQCQHGQAQWFGRQQLCVRCGAAMHTWGVASGSLDRIETPSGLELARDSQDDVRRDPR